MTGDGDWESTTEKLNKEIEIVDPRGDVWEIFWLGGDRVGSRAAVQVSIERSQVGFSDHTFDATFGDR